MTEKTKQAGRSDFLPCGHTEAQAAWLGCTPEQCRPIDARISAEYVAEHRKEE